MSTPNQLKDLKLDDGQIEELSANSDQLVLTLKTWEEKKQLVRFKGVIAFEAVGAVGVDLSHATSGGFDEYVVRSLALIEEKPDTAICYALFSSWSDVPVLKVVASGFDVV
jgi:hypothetical protein